MALLPRGPVSLEYPKMLYRQDGIKTTGEDETLIVQNVDEQQAAEAEGWHPTPHQNHPIWVEIDRRRGTQYRRVLIRNSQEEKLFKENVDLKNWTKEAQYALAGRPTGLDELISEHHVRLDHALDECTAQPDAGRGRLCGRRLNSDNVGHEPAEG